MFQLLQRAELAYRPGFNSNGQLLYTLGLAVPTWHKESTREWGLGLVLKFDPHVKFTSGVMARLSSPSLHCFHEIYMNALIDEIKMTDFDCVVTVTIKLSTKDYGET